MENNQQPNLHHELRERTSGYIVAALSVVAGLAWNEAIRGLIDYIFPVSKDSLLVKFAYAIIITVIVVLVTVSILRVLGKKTS